MARYRVTDGHQVIVDERTVGAGEDVDLDRTDAAPLVAAGVLKPAKRKVAKAT